MAKAQGMKVGDLLISVNGNPVTDSTSMLTLISAITPETGATLKVIREEKELELKVVVGKRPKLAKKK